MADIISRIADFLQDVPIRSDATGMFIERDDLRAIFEEHNDLARARLREKYKERTFIPPNDGVLIEADDAKREYTQRFGRESLALSNGMIDILAIEGRPAPPSFVERV